MNTHVGEEKVARYSSLLGQSMHEMIRRPFQVIVFQCFLPFTSFNGSTSIIFLLASLKVKDEKREGKKAK